MPEQTDIIDGWLVREAPDGGFVVCDDHGVVEGPFRNRSEAIAAALNLPKRNLADWQLGDHPQAGDQRHDAK